MRSIPFAACALFGLLALSPGPAKASVVFDEPGLAHDCYMLAEYGTPPKSKEVSPLDVCTEALTESSKPTVRAGTLVNRSIIFLRMGNLRRSGIDCKRAIGIAPNLGEAHVDLGVVLMRQGFFGEALDEINKGIELGTNKLYLAYYNRGLVYELLKDANHAYADYKKAAELKPDFQQAADELTRFKVVGPAPAP